MTKGIYERRVEAEKLAFNEGAEKFRVRSILLIQQDIIENENMAQTLDEFDTLEEADAQTKEMIEEHLASVESKYKEIQLNQLMLNGREYTLGMWSKEDEE